MANNINDNARELMKMAKDAGRDLSEVEAIALLNDAFYAKAYSHTAPTPNISKEDLGKILAGWLARNP